MIEQVLLQRNIRHFRQAENTPLLGQETIAKIGFGASSDYADQIINGNANLDILTDDPMSIKLLKIFGTKRDEIKIEVTKEKMMKAYKIWKERTATSPSGQHLGRFHALIRYFKATNDQEREILEQKREGIIQVQFNMLF